MSEDRIKFRVGNHEIFVTPEDARLLESDMMLLGNHYIHVDWTTMIGWRVDPATVRLTYPSQQRVSGRE